MSWVIAHAISAVKSETPHNQDFVLIARSKSKSLYQALYLGRKGGLSRALTAKLRTGRPLRKRRRSVTERIPRYVAPAVLIHCR